MWKVWFHRVQRRLESETTISQSSSTQRSASWLPRRLIQFILNTQSWFHSYTLMNLIYKLHFNFQLLFLKGLLFSCNHRASFIKPCVFKTTRANHCINWSDHLNGGVMRIKMGAKRQKVRLSAGSSWEKTNMSTGGSDLDGCCRKAHSNRMIWRRRWKRADLDIVGGNCWSRSRQMLKSGERDHLGSLWSCVWWRTAGRGHSKEARGK